MEQEIIDGATEYEPTKEDLHNGWTKDTLNAYIRSRNEPRQQKPVLPSKQVRYNPFRN